MCRWMGSHFHEKYKKLSCVTSPLILLSQSYQRTVDFFVLSFLVCVKTTVDLQNALLASGAPWIVDKLIQASFLQLI